MKLGGLRQLTKLPTNCHPAAEPLPTHCHEEKEEKRQKERRYTNLALM